MPDNSRYIDTNKNRTIDTNDFSEDQKAFYNDREKSYTVNDKINKNQVINDLTPKNTTVSGRGVYNTSHNIYHSNNIFLPKETDYFSKRYRYGVLNTYQALTTCREYLFFTKPDLNIYERDERNRDGTPLSKLNPGLESYSFWRELDQKFPEVLACLQSSKTVNNSPNNIKVNSEDPFNHLLENMVQSNLDVPGLDSSSEAIDTPINLYGVGYKYRGSSEASDDTFDFSLEFKDTKYLPVYYYFKAYEEYETLKHHGVISPYIRYITNKVLHDQYSIYKFLVDEDGETILYYAKYYGVKSYNLPRDVFNTTAFDNGLSYSISFNAAFVEDMDPTILMDFNRLSYPYSTNFKYFIGPYNEIFDTTDGRAAQSAIVVEETNGTDEMKVVGIRDNDSTLIIHDTNNHPHTNAPGKKVYKLKWKGNDNS